jgi:dethiobiotin synthetase
MGKAENQSCRRVCFISGTGTGVGKTHLTALLLWHLRTAGIDAMAIKPISSGDRGDAELLRAAGGGVLNLNEVNPLHFRRPLAPPLAARAERKSVRVEEVLDIVSETSRKCELLLVEGAGGWFTPLGDGFGMEEVHRMVGGHIVLVAANQLGAIHNVRATVLAMGKAASSVVGIVLNDVNTDHSSNSNAKMLREVGLTAPVLRMKKSEPIGHEAHGFEGVEKKTKKLLRDLRSLIDSSRCPALRCAAKNNEEIR